jgi:hypothetical protein
MPRVGFEPTIPAFERAKTFHALERAATVIGKYIIKSLISVYELGLGLSTSCSCPQAASPLLCKCNEIL